MPRPYRREKRYVEHLNIPMTAEMRTALESLADQEQIAVVEAARRCIHAGLPAVRERAEIEAEPEGEGA